ncbi:MAG: trypsin-like peptidase domain-containing protein [Alphaproteobacteria bacterium]|nr:trypsin-like peptidase domain-containing protein [Alphaproteobacteria bacterium]
MLKFWSVFVLGLILALPLRAEQHLLEDVIEEVNPSVVSIAVDVSDDEQALGAGIIISAAGYVVTNAHVMENAKKITLQLPNGETFAANLVGVDEKTDIALLKVKNPINLEAGHFGDSDAIRVGNQVFAIGNPFGLGNSVSLGIISAKERDIDKGPYDNFLQTDAAINQGNSGGPLFNMDGKIIGMSTAIFSEDGKNVGVGFATPSNVVKWVVSQLKQNGKVIRGWLGMSVQKVFTKDDTNSEALIVSAMEENSPAAKAGLKVGDKILSLGQVSLKNPRLFSYEISKLAPDTEIQATIVRDAQTIETKIIVAKAPEELKVLPKDNFAEMRSFEELGLDKYKIGKAVLFETLGISAYYEETTKELAITAVKNDSEAENKGIKMGDRIVMVNDKPIFGVEDMKVKIKQPVDGKIKLQLKDSDGSYNVYLNVKAAL